MKTFGHGLGFVKLWPRDNFTKPRPRPEVVSEMTYNVSMGTLNPTIPYHTKARRARPRPQNSRLRPKNMAFDILFIIVV